MLDDVDILLIEAIEEDCSSHGIGNRGSLICFLALFTDDIVCSTYPSPDRNSQG